VLVRCSIIIFHYDAELSGHSKFGRTMSGDRLLFPALIKEIEHYKQGNLTQLLSQIPLLTVYGLTSSDSITFLPFRFTTRAIETSVLSGQLDHLVTHIGIWHTCSIDSTQSFLREKCYDSFNRTNSSKKNLKETVNNSKQTYWREVIWKCVLTTHYLKCNLKDHNKSASSSKQ